MKEVFATTWAAILYDKWGAEWIEWDPIALSLNMKSELGIEPNRGAMDKIQAVAALYTSDLFQVSVETFAAICNAFSGSAVLKHEFIPPNIDEITWGCIEAKLILGEDLQKDNYSHSVATFVGSMLDNEGIYKPPGPLDFAEYPEDIDQKNADAVAEDPIMYKMYWDKQQDRKGSLTKNVQKKVALLLDQLIAAPLEAADIKPVRDLMSKITS